MKEETQEITGSRICGVCGIRTVAAEMVTGRSTVAAAKMMAGPDSQAATASGRTQQGCSGEAAKLPDLCRNSRTAAAGSRCRGRAACSVTTEI